MLSDRVSLVAFISKRIKKSYPMYLLTTAVSVAYLVKWNGISALNYKDIFLNLTLTTSGWIEDIYPFNLPCWFLSQLLLLYIIWFIVTKYTKEKTAYWYMGLILWGRSFLEVDKDRRGFYEGIAVCAAILFAVAAAVLDLRSISGDVRYVFTFLFVPSAIFIALDLTPIKKIMESKILVLLFKDISTNVFFCHVMMKLEQSWRYKLPKRL